MTSDELKTAATGFLPGVVVGAVVVWLAMSMTPAPIVPVSLPSDTKDSEQKSAPETKTAPAQTTTSGNKLEVVDQPAGRAVIVKSVTVEKTSWIAVRDFANGKIGNVLGASRREPGTSRDTVVDLLRGTEPGKQYAVVLFIDNGDGAFSTKTDTPFMSGTETYRVIMTATTPVAPNGR